MQKEKTMAKKRQPIYKAFAFISGAVVFCVATKAILAKNTYFSHMLETQIKQISIIPKSMLARYYAIINAKPDNISSDEEKDFPNKADTDLCIKEKTRYNSQWEAVYKQ